MLCSIMLYNCTEGLAGSKQCLLHFVQSAGKIRFLQSGNRIHRRDGCIENIKRTNSYLWLGSRGQMEIMKSCI